MPWPPPQQITVDVDPALKAIDVAPQSRQIPCRHPMDALTLPIVKFRHHVATEPGRKGLRINIAKARLFQAGHTGVEHKSKFLKPSRAQDRPEHQPLRNSLLCCILRPAKPGAADQPLIKQDLAGINELYRPFGRAIGKNCFSQRIHSGKDGPSRRGKRLFRLQHQRKLDLIEATDMIDRSGPCRAALTKRMGKGVVMFAQTHRRNQRRKPLFERRYHTPLCHDALPVFAIAAIAFCSVIPDKPDM